MSVARKVVLALFCIALAPTVLADKIKDVNVVNTPDVNVVNNENSPVPVTIQNDAQSIVEWRYVGYTDHKDNGRFEYAGLIA